MRWTELGFSFLLIVYQLILIFPRRNRAVFLNYTLYLAGGALLFCLIFEGYRWQMLPGVALFLVQALYLLISFPSLRGKTALEGFFRSLGRLFRGLIVTLTFLFSLACLALILLFPLPESTRPGGQAVSTHSYSLKLMDDTLPVRVWYPASEIEGPREPRDESSVLISRELYDKFGIPLWFDLPLSTVSSSRISRAPFKPYPFGSPVIYFLGGQSLESHTYLLESLASWGFFVVASEQIVSPAEPLPLAEEDWWRLPATPALWNAAPKEDQVQNYRRDLFALTALVRKLNRTTGSPFMDKIQENSAALLLSEEASTLVSDYLGPKSTVKGVGVIGSGLPEIEGASRPLLILQSRHRSDLTDDGILRPWLFYYNLRSRLTPDVHERAQLLLAEYFKMLLFEGDGTYLMHGNRGFPDLALIYRPGRSNW